MADRFSGMVMIGGKLPQADYDRCVELLEPNLVDGLQEDGSGVFCECNGRDFEDLIEFCKARSIALCIQWDSKWEFSGFTEYWIGGERKEFASDNEGRIVIPVEELQRNPDVTVAKFIETMGIPDFPNLEIEGETDMSDAAFCGPG
jgi:hypothetical protein